MSPDVEAEFDGVPTAANIKRTTRAARSARVVRKLLFEPSIASQDQGSHVTGQSGSLDEAPQWPERRLELDHVRHQRAISVLGEAVLVPPPFERTARLLVDETGRSFILADS